MKAKELGMDQERRFGLLSVVFEDLEHEIHRVRRLKVRIKSVSDSNSS